ncbi:MAG TPA: RIP metalloprotease RseP [Thiobacillaceae bacterium]|nr:RIP metalloprotease RseP [Thiobacillaceae bacterium]HNU63487.1 RIP metalloprotease RseP [Thiobacillaceae bacterium]
MTTVLAFLITLAVLIVFHEFGHYLVARMAGVRVLRFSIGFGQIMARRLDRRGTEWALSAIPLGGYVKMLDEREGAVPPEQLHQAFNRKGVGARAAIVAAGPLANFLLAILLFWGLFMVGVPVAKPVLGDPPSQSAAAMAGIQRGETVLGVNGEKTQSWQDLHWMVLKNALRNGTITLETTDAAGHYHDRHLQATTADESLERDPLQALGLVQYLPPLPPVIGHLTADGPAQRAGLRTGDRVWTVDSQTVELWQDLVRKVRAAPGRALDLRIERDGQPLEIRITPTIVQEEGQAIGRIGAAPRVDPAIMAPYLGESRYAPWQALQHAVVRTWELSAFSLEMLGRMLIGQASLKNLSGPITIADYAGQSAQGGLASFVAFLALVSVSLGVLNLLPVPLLDGGHLLYYLAELVTGRPVPEKTQEIGQKIGMGLLALLMFFALYNDLQRLFAG